MTFWRNPEVRRSLVLYGAGILLLCLAGLLVRPAFLWAAAGVLAAAAVHFIITKKRYDRISQLALDLGAALHDNGSVKIDRQGEGELSILETEVGKLSNRMEEQNRLLVRDKEYLAQLIADIAHQLRTPLTTERLYLTMLREELSGKEGEDLCRSALMLEGRMEWLVDALLKLSKFDSGTAEMKHEAVNVRELIRKAADPITIPLELREIELVVKADPDASYEGDMAWTTEALGNILKNGMEHAPRNSVIEVEARETPVFCEITVRDHGEGFSGTDLDHLFDRYYRGRNASGESIGIGLALARQIVKAQNGTLAAENAPGGGARFIMRFYRRTV